MPELNAFLSILVREEEEYIDRLRARFAFRRTEMYRRMRQLEGAGGQATPFQGCGEGQVCTAGVGQNFRVEEWGSEGGMVREGSGGKCSVLNFL